MIQLNRAVAHGYAHGPAAGLALLAEARASDALDDYPLAVAAEADLTARQGDRDRAAALFRQAAAVAHSEPERRALLARTEELFSRRARSAADADASVADAGPREHTAKA